MAKTAAEELEEAMNPEPAAPAEPAKPAAPAEPAAPKAGEPAKPAAPAKPAEDPEIDLTAFGYGKVKKSQLEAWKAGGLKEEDYRKKTEELAAREAQIENLNELSDFLAKNPKKLQKVLAVLEEVEEMKADEGTPSAATAPELAAQQAKLKAILDQLDPDDPLAELIKAQHAELSEIRKTMTGWKQQEKDFLQARQQEEFQASVQYAQGILAEGLNGIAKDLEFESEEEKGPWRQLSVTLLKQGNTKGFKDEASFKAAIKVAGEAAFQQIRAIVEAGLKKQLGKKGPVVPGAGGGGSALPKEVPLTMENLNDTVVAELEAALAAKKE